MSRPGTFMGRKRWWRGGPELLVLFILHHIILGDGDVGCLFSKSLCDSRTETCYNDLAFGRCLPLYSDLNEENYYQYDFDVNELKLLRLQLERLEVDGYKWSHPYTQCIMQMSLYNLHHGENYDLRLCQHLKQRTRFENKNEIDQAKIPTIAIVKFMPNNDKFNSQFANELYYPPGTQDQYFRDYNNEFSQLPYKEQLKETDTQVYNSRYNPKFYNEYDSLTNEENYEEENDENNSPKRPVTFDRFDERLYRTRRQPYNLRDYDDNAMESFKNALKKEELKKKLSDNKNSNSMDSLTADKLEFLVNDKSDDYSDKKNNEDGDIDVEYEKTFSRKYKPRKFTELPNKDESFLENVKRYDNFKDNYDSDDYDDVNDVEELPQKDSASIKNGIYTEGGLVQSVDDKSNIGNDENTYDNLFENDLSELLWRRELAGFKRRERLDVKKPGPPFSTNNYAFKTPTPIILKNENRPFIETEQDNNVLLTPKKEIENVQQANSSKSYNNIDLDHVYIEFQQPFHAWIEAKHVVQEVEKLLGLKFDSLKDIRVGRTEVTFKVEKNNQNYSATDVVNKIDDIRSKLKDTLEVDVIRAGIGDKKKTTCNAGS